MDESQGFAGFSPMKRMRPASTFGLTGEQQQQPQSQSQQQQQQQVSPDENRQPFGSVLGNKRGRRACGGSGSGESSDMMMQCTPMKRGHVATAADEELDRLTYSKRYVQQIEQHLKYQKETYETKLRSLLWRPSHGPHLGSMCMLFRQRVPKPVFIILSTPLLRDSI